MKKVNSPILSLLLILMCAAPAMGLVISNINRSTYVVSYDNLGAGKLVYVDRTFTFTSGPAYVVNQTYIQTANNDKSSTGDSFLTFTINQDSTVYVAHDDTITSKPTWLSSFVDTGDNLVTNDGGKNFSLYSKTFLAGSVVLGGNGGGTSSSMYSVVVIPVPVSSPPGPATNPSPINNALNVSFQADLSWTAGTEATSQNVYFGQTNPPALIGNQTAATYDPGTLDLGTTYYWRIDSVNSLGTTTGTVWSFTTQITTAAGHWPMDDNVATAVVADIASTNNGTFYSGGVAQNTNLHHSADRKEGTGALDFDGNDYVALPRNTVFEKGNTTTKRLTAMAWIKDESGGAAGWSTVMGTGDGGWLLARNGDSGNVMTAGFWFTSPTALIIVDSPASISDGQWHHVAVVYDGSSVVLYVDGVGTSAAAAGTIDNMFNKGVLIGQNAQVTGRYWNGLIDDVRIYDYAMSGEDIYHMLNPVDAWNPSPANNAQGQPLDTTLSWLAGVGAVSHDVYFGASQSAVAAAQRLAGDITGDGTVDISDLAVLVNQWLTDPGTVFPSADISFSGKVDLEDFAALGEDWNAAASVEFKGSQTGTLYNPGAMEHDTTYYWRVDQVDGSQDSPHTGRVWSFTTAAQPGDIGEIVFPGTTWATKTPAELGLDGAKLDLLASRIAGNGIIIRQGYVVKTWGNQSSKADWASAAKPVVSTMLMFAIKEGIVPNVNKKIGDYGWVLSAKDQPMEFYHLANMTSGYARGEAPGARWAYNDYAINLYVKTLFDRAYGNSNANAVATASTRLGALGFQDGTIFSSRGGYGITTSVRDFARIGWLWCNKGYWNGTQLLPKQYFDDYMKAHVTSGTPRTSSSGSDYLGVGTYGGGSDQWADGPGVYGFNWWCNDNQANWPDAPADTVQANGHWGVEIVTVIPSLSVVLSTYGGNMGSHTTGSSSSTMNQNLKLLAEACSPTVLLANGDCTVRNGVNYDKYININNNGELGLLVKNATDASWIEFTFGSAPVSQATFAIYQDDPDPSDFWEIVVRGAEFTFDETTFTGTDFNSWTRVGTIPNVKGPFTSHSMDMTSYYNSNLGKTITLHLYRDVQPAGSGPVFQDRELTRKYPWSTNAHAPRITLQY